MRLKSSSTDVDAKNETRVVRRTTRTNVRLLLLPPIYYLFISRKLL
jgi:hypothetical protein